MSQWLLLINAEETDAEAIELTPQTAPDGTPVGFLMERSSTNPGFFISLFHKGKPYKNDNLRESAKKGGNLGYQLLWEENPKQKLLKNDAGDHQFHASIYFDLASAPLNVTGKSADLLFALAVVTAALPREGGYSHYAATGWLDEPTGAVYPVKGIAKKLEVAIAKLKDYPGEKFVFYPIGNDQDIPSVLRESAKAHYITLSPLEWFDEALEKLRVPVQIHIGNPYRGLQSFSYQHRGVYFGRNQEAHELADELAKMEASGTSPAVSILAASGAGKTSFIQAGLRPALEKRLADRQWIFQSWTPGMARQNAADQESGLTAAALWQHLRGYLLTEGLATNPDAMEKQAQPEMQGFPGLARDFKATLPADRRSLLIIDQAEELFTLGFEEAALQGFFAFFDGLRDLGLWIVLSMRNDFYHLYQKHFQERCNHEHKWRELNRAALDSIIQEPAKRARRPPIRFETLQDHNLATRLREDMERETDALPLLQFALTALYERSDQRRKAMEADAGLATNAKPTPATGAEGDDTLPHRPTCLTLTLADYEAMGCLSGAIGNSAEAAFSDLDKAAQDALPKLLWDLVVLPRDGKVEIGKRYSAQTVKLDTCPPGNPRRELIDTLAAKRLLVIDHPLGGSSVTVRVAHEALLNHWQTATALLDQMRDDLPVRSRVSHDCHLWQQQGQTPDGLLQAGWRLAEGERLLDEREAFLDAELIAYIRASSEAEAERQRLEAESKRRLRRNAWLLSVVAMISFIALGVAVFAFREVDIQKDEAIQQKKVAEDRTQVIEKQKAELASALARTDFLSAVDLMKQDKPRDALAYLARAIRISEDRNSMDFAVSIILSESFLEKLAYQAIPFDGFNISVQGMDYNLAENTWFFMRNAPHLKSIENPDGQKLFIPLGENYAVMTNAEMTKSISPPLKHENLVTDATFSPDWQKVITASADKTAQVWDIKTGSPLLKIPIRHEDQVNTAIFSPDGQWVATGSRDGTARVWEAKTGKPITQKFIKEKDAIASIGFSPDERWLVTAATDRISRIWDVHTGDAISSALRGESTDLSAWFSKDGRRVITRAYFSPTEPKIVNAWNAQVSQISKPVFMSENSSPLSEEIARAIKKNGKYLATISDDDEEKIEIINIEDEVKAFDKYAEINFVESELKKHIVNIINNEYVVDFFEINENKNIVYTITNLDEVIEQDERDSDDEESAGETDDDSDSGDEENVEKDDTDASKPDSKKPQSRYMVRAWDIKTSELLFSASFPHRIDQVTALSTDGKKLAILLRPLNQPPTVHILDATTGKQISKSVIPLIDSYRFEAIFSANFSPDGQRLVTASKCKGCGDAKIWDTQTGEMLYQLISTNEDYVYMVKYSLDGKYILSSGYKVIKVWDQQTGDIINTFKCSEPIIEADFAASGNRILALAKDNMVRTWDVQTGKEAFMAFKLKAQIDKAIFSRSGQRLISFSTENKLQIYDIPIDMQLGKRFADFLDKLSNRHLPENSNEITNVPYINTISNLRAWLTTPQDLTPEARHLIEWLLSDPLERTVTPSGKQTVKERVQQLIDIDTVASLNEALDYCPGHPMALVKLAAATLRDSKPEEREANIPRAHLWANLALKYAPEDTAVRAIAEPVLRETGGS